ncbi:unnamed protein product [Anisakis simplex]|uniref:CCDC92 domain-containing protein n=1 Tax=Anisakis simplex TaxID=6269 RepID=A0A0M3JYX1_ANISI|nr:unnamed protein product [Anisakis simplex]
MKRRYCRRRQFQGNNTTSCDIQCLIEEICKNRISAAIEERDDLWRRHEKAQIAFLQKENASMLTGLHTEIERLHHELRDAHRQLYVEEKDTETSQLEEENAILRQRLAETERSNEELSRKLDETHRQSLLMEQQLTNAINIFKNQLAYQGNKIRQLTEEVRERTATISQLMTELRFGSASDLACNRNHCIVHANSNANVDYSFYVTKSNQRRVSSSDPSDNNVVSKCHLVRSVSVTYPGGRPNVITQRYKHPPGNPRSHHLPCLYSRWQSFSVGGCNNIEKPRKFNSTPIERMSLTRSLNESDRASTSNAESSTSNK